MSFKCVLEHCGAKKGDNVCLHSFPKDSAVKNDWCKFVQSVMPNWLGPSTQSRLCSSHFRAEDFTNFLMFKAKLATFLCLKKNAIPSITGYYDNETRVPSNLCDEPPREVNERVETLLTNKINASTQCRLYKTNMPIMKNASTQCNLMYEKITSCRSVRIQTSHCNLKNKCKYIRKY
jgi:hypothetical protein